MKSIKALTLLLSIAAPFVSIAYNETGEALPSYSSSNSNSGDYLAHWWFNLGIGAGSSFRTDGTEEINGASAQLSFNGALSPSSMVTIYSNGIGGDDDNSAFDAGIMLGLIKRQPNWYASAAAGLCYYEVEGTKSDNFWTSQYSSHSIGIPFQAEAFWTPFKHFGVGVIGHVVASKDPYANAMVAIQIYG